jgi:hypothetical protein
MKDLGFGDRARAGAADQQAAEHLDVALPPPHFSPHLAVAERGAP